MTFPVVLGICLDAEALWLAIDPANSARPSQLSHGAYAVREGLVPLLNVLKKHGCHATFYVPGWTAERHPHAVPLIAAQGHELGAHNFTHLSPLKMTAEQEEDELRQGIEIIAAQSGARPTTWRSPSWEWSAQTQDILARNGIRTSTNFHDSVGPYCHNYNGQPTDLVELPVQWHLADAPYFIHGGRMERVIRNPAEIETMWFDEFEAHYDWAGAFFHLTLHVQLIALPARLKMLDRLLGRMSTYGRTCFMTAKDLADSIRGQTRPEVPTHASIVSQ